MVFAIGGLMAAAGVAYLILGFDIVMTERGSAMTIGGVIALCAGLVTIAIGCGLLRLTQILRVLESIGRYAPSEGTAIAAVEPVASGTLAPLAGVAAGAAVLGAALATSTEAKEKRETDIAHPDQHEMTLPEISADVGAVSSGVDDRLKSDAPIADVLDDILVDAPPAEIVTEQSVDESVTDRTADAEIYDLDSLAPTAAEEQDEAGAEVASDDQPDETGSGDEAPDAVETTALADAGAEYSPASDLAQPEMQSLQPVQSTGPAMLGTYRAGGRTYTMYSDGSVEAATAEGVEKFESMQALREHLVKT